MSVLKGEGKVPILFGSTSIAAGSRTHSGYLARPDLAGEWPTVVVAASAWGVTSNTKDICRRLARQGFAVIAPALYATGAPKRSAPADEAWAAAAGLDSRRVRRTLDDIVGFIRNPSGFWSSAESGFGVLGLGSGGGHAAALAAADAAAALGIVSTPPDEVAASLPAYGGALLGLFGRDDERAPVDSVHELREAIPGAELVIYSGVGGDFLDDYLESYDVEVAMDAMERLAEFFEKHLPSPPA